MQIHTEKDFVKVLTQKDTTDPKLLRQLTKWDKLYYKDGSMSAIPKGFFRNWMDEDISNSNFGTFYIGKNSGIGIDSIVKYDGNSQSLRIGRYVAGGLRLKFVLNGQHDMNTISTYMFGQIRTKGMKNSPPPSIQRYNFEK